MAAVKEDNIDAIMELAPQPSFDMNAPMGSFNAAFINITSVLDFNMHMKEDLTLIDVAAMFGSVRCFKYLHVLGARKTPMTASLAVWGGSFEIIRILDSDGEEFQYGIRYAAGCFRNDILDWLLEMKFDENNHEEITEAFHIAATIGNYYALMRLYNKAIQFEYTFNNTRTALQMAILINHYFMVEILISASDYLCDMPYRSAPICHACQVGNVKIVRMLYQKGSDVNVALLENRTPIELAIESKSLKMLKFLFEETDIRVKSNIRPFLSIIQLTKDLAIIKYFTTTKFFNVNEQTDKGMNALHIAVSTDIPEIVEYIISIGVDPNHEDSDKITPYAYSVIYGFKRSRAVLEAHDEICTEMSSDQIHSMASVLLNIAIITDLTDNRVYQEIEMKIKKYGGEPVEVLKGIEITFGYPNIIIMEWLNNMGLKIAQRGQNKLIIF